MNTISERERERRLGRAGRAETVEAEVRHWGNCLAVRIPKALARELRVEGGSPVRLGIENGALVIRPLRVVPTLENLLAGVTPDNVHGDVARPVSSEPGGA